MIHPENRKKIFRLGLTMLCIVLVALIVRVYTLTPQKNESLSAGTKIHVATTTTISLPPLPNEPAVPVRPKKPVPPPESIITATAYLVGNADTGTIYLSKNVNKVLQIASITKLFDALAIQNHALGSSTITITDAMLQTYPDDPHKLKVGESFTVNELMYPLILESSNNVAEAIATTSGRGVFLGYMSEVASKLGMSATSFKDASGLGDGNVSTAADLFELAQNLYHSEHAFLDFTVIPSKKLEQNATHGEYEFKNTNVFVGDPHYLGGKTGRSDSAGETMLSIFNYDINGKMYPLVIIVLHSEYGNRQVDSEALYLKAIEKITGVKL
jgi:D-alanyl-D-alanine carboxypeptidase